MMQEEAYPDKEEAIKCSDNACHRQERRYVTDDIHASSR